MNRRGVSPNRRNSHFFSKMKEMKIYKVWIGLVVALGLVVAGCGDPEIAGDAVMPETGMLRVVNLSQDELQVKFGSQLNQLPLPAKSGTLWQKQRAGSTDVTVTKGEQKDLGGKAEVTKGELTSFIVMPGEGGIRSMSYKENVDAQSSPDSASVKVVHAPQEGLQSPTTVTAPGESATKLEPLKPHTVSIKSAGKSTFVFEMGPGSKVELEFEFELGGSYTIFVTAGNGGPVAAMGRNDQKLTAVGESGASP